MDNELLVKTVRELCKKNNIPVSQLENELNFGAGLISRWVKSSPSLDKIIDIADFFHVSLDEVVGRDKYIVNDEFIKLLCDKTTNKEIQWNIFDKSVDESGIKQYTEPNSFDSFVSQDDFEYFCDTHKEKSYYFEYMNGYISIYALYEHHNVTEPRTLKLFIQPDIQSELIEQSFDYQELLSLWLKVLISLEDNAPDEIRAEDLKNNFINSFNNTTSNNKNKEIESLNKMLNNPEVMKLMKTMKTPEMLKLKELYSDPNFQAAMQIANKLQKYFKD